MAATVEELKEMIMDLKVELLEVQVPDNCCPYAYFNYDKNTDCGDISCFKCKNIFFENYRNKIRKEVNQL